MIDKTTEFILRDLNISEFNRNSIYQASKNVIIHELESIKLIGDCIEVKGFAFLTTNEPAEKKFIFLNYQDTSDFFVVSAESTERKDVSFLYKTSDELSGFRLLWDVSALLKSRKPKKYILLISVNTPESNYLLPLNNANQTFENLKLPSNNNIIVKLSEYLTISINPRFIEKITIPVNSKWYKFLQKIYQRIISNKKIKKIIQPKVKKLKKHLNQVN